MTVRLSSPRIGEIELDDCDRGYLVRSVEIGPPEAREVVAPRPLSDGTIDRTRFAGSRSVNVDLTIVERTPIFHPAVWEPRASLRVDGAGWVTITELLDLQSPVLDLRVEMALDDWTDGVQVIAAQNALGDAGWLWAIDPLGRSVYLTSPNGVHFELPGTNLLPNPSVEENLDGYEVVRHLRNILPNDGTFEQELSGWVTATPNVEADRDTAHARTGNWSLRVTRTNGNGAWQVFTGAGSYNPKVPARPGGIVTTRAWVYHEREDATPIVVRHRHYLGNTLIEEVGETHTEVPPGVWTEVSHTGKVPPGVDGITVRFTSHGNVSVGESMWLDDVTVDQYHENLLTDQQASIENGSTDPGAPVAGFNRWGSPQAVARTTDTARHGGSSLRMTRSDDSAGGAQANPLTTKLTGWPAWPGVVPVKPGSTYTIMASGWAPPNASPDYLQVSAPTLYAAPGENVGSLTEFTRVTATAGWVDARFVFTVPADSTAVAASVLFAMYVGAGESAYLDRLGVFEGDVPLSAWSLPMTRMADPDAPDGDHVLLLTREHGPGHVEVVTAPVPASPGKDYGAAVAAHAPVGRTVTGSIECLDAAGEVIASDAMDRSGVGRWGTVIAGTVESPEGTTQVRMRVRGRDFAESETMRLDAFQVVETDMASIVADDGARGFLRLVVDGSAGTVSSYVGESLNGPWSTLYADVPRPPGHQSSAPITVGAVPLVGEVGCYGLVGNIYAGSVEHESGFTVIGWDGYTIANVEGSPFVLYGDAEEKTEPPVLIAAAWTERFDSRRDLLDRIAPYLHPGVVSELAYATDPNAEVRRVRVRAADWSAPWENRWHVETTLGFVTVGSPWARGPEQSFRLSPGIEEVAGRTYDLTFDRVYPAGGGATMLRAENRGNMPAEWEATVFGPITGFTLINTATGERLSFPDLSVPGGQNVVIDSGRRTVLANGDPGSSRYGAIDFARSRWFHLRPGVNLLRVISSSFSAPSQTHFRFADTYLL